MLIKKVNVKYRNKTLHFKHDNSEFKHSHVPTEMLMNMVNDVIPLKTRGQRLTHLRPTCSSTVQSWLNVSGLFGWQILPLIIYRVNNRCVKRLRCYQKKIRMGAAPFDEICACELPGTSRRAVRQTELRLEMCHLEDEGRGVGVGVVAEG